MTNAKKKEPEKIENGDLVKDLVTGIEGIVIAYSDYVTGVPRVAIQPSGQFDGKPAEPLHLDLPQAFLLKKGEVKVNFIAGKNEFELGDEVKDSITGFTGICYGIAIHLYSCSKVLIQPKKLVKETGQPVESVWFDAPLVRLVKKASSNTKKTVTAAKSTGGPQDRHEKKKIFIPKVIHLTVRGLKAPHPFV